jgi:hypothetical protein
MPWLGGRPPGVVAEYVSYGRYPCWLDAVLIGLGDGKGYCPLVGVCSGVRFRPCAWPDDVAGGGNDPPRDDPIGGDVCGALLFGLSTGGPSFSIDERSISSNYPVRKARLFV